MSPEKALEGIDLLLLTSQSEAMPLVVLEAMAASVPVVAHDVGNVADLLGSNSRSEITNSPAGFIAPSAANQRNPTPAELAGVVIDVLGNEGAYRAMRAAGPQRVKQFFDRTEASKAWKALYSA